MFIDFPQEENFFKVLKEFTYSERTGILFCFTRNIGVSGKKGNKMANSVIKTIATMDVVEKLKSSPDIDPNSCPKIEIIFTNTPKIPAVLYSKDLFEYTNVRFDSFVP